MRSFDTIQKFATAVLAIVGLGLKPANAGTTDETDLKAHRTERLTLVKLLEVKFHTTQDQNVNYVNSLSDEKVINLLSALQSDQLSPMGGHDIFHK